MDAFGVSVSAPPFVPLPLAPNPDDATQKLYTRPDDLDVIVFVSQQNPLIISIQSLPTSATTTTAG